MEALKVREVSKLLGIYPNSKTTLTAWDRVGIIRHVDMRLIVAANGIEWARATGRISGTAELAIRGLGSYQTLKLLVYVANEAQNMGEIPSILKRLYG